MKHTCQTLYLATLVAVSSYFTSGCISGTIVGAGKRYEHLEAADTSAEQVRRELGSPSYRRFYGHPTPLNSTPEYKSFVKSTGASPFVWGNGAFQKAPPVVSCEVYTRRGPFADMSRGQAYGMVGGMTLGVGDVLLLPIAIGERSLLSKQKFSLTFWYNQDRKVQGFYRGDIRDPTSTW